jgi:type II secretory pathway pseudopilin PulG
MFNKKLPGYTLIELMVVFSMIGIFTVLTIPSYIKFNRTQEIKQAALLLKSKIRDAQNRSFSGEKSQTVCTESNVLEGFFVETTINSQTIKTGGSCGGVEFNTEDTNFVSPNAKIVDMHNVSGGTCGALTLTGNNMRINFRPIGKGVDFYDWTTRLILAVTKISLKVADTNGNYYYVIISSAGDIYDSSKCI